MGSSFLLSQGLAMLFKLTSHSWPQEILFAGLLDCWDYMHGPLNSSKHIKCPEVSIIKICELKPFGQRNLWRPTNVCLQRRTRPGLHGMKQFYHCCCSLWCSSVNGSGLAAFHNLSHFPSCLFILGQPCLSAPPMGLARRGSLLHCMASLIVPAQASWIW